MLHRTGRLAVIGACVGVLLSGGLAGYAGPVNAQPASLALGFDQIEARMQADSPRLRIIAQDAAAVAAERDMALQWSNPSLAYDREEIAGAAEWQFSLHKRFDRPFTGTRARAGWSDRIRAVELGSDQAAAELLTELKTGYVRLGLLAGYLERLALLSRMMELAAEVADQRHKAGELSGVESRLTRLSTLSVSASRSRARQVQREVVAVWKAELGIPVGTDVQLTTPIAYRPVKLADVSEYVAMLDVSPGLQSRTLLAEALGKQAAAARPGLVPGLDIYGGYKRVDPEDEGFVVGVALSLPIFDRNQGVARQYEVRQRIVQNELNLNRARFAAEITGLVDLIRETQPELELFGAHLAEQPPLAETLLFAYQEGSLTLDAFLNAIQIELSTLADYHEQIAAHYENIFRLEAITGVEIVNFAPTGE